MGIIQIDLTALLKISQDHTMLNQRKYLENELKIVVSILRHQENVLLAKKISKGRTDLGQILKEIERKYWNDKEKDILDTLEARLQYPPYILEVNLIQFTTNKDNANDQVSEIIYNLWFQKAIRGHQTDIFNQNSRAAS